MGNDTLTSGYYTDTYLFNLGDGEDVISENASTGYTDALRFGAGIASDQLWFNRNGNLEVSIIGTEDRVTVDDWYSGSSYQIEQIQAGNSVLLVNAMAAFDPPAAGETELLPQQREQLDPVLAAAWEG